ncbi:MAG: DNA polymerase III subunit alpha, partial [Campylobacterales bacterium]
MVPLHVHTDYSILSSPMKLEWVVKRAKELGYPAIGVAEIFNLFGAVQFYKLAQKEGIKPILGTEIALHTGEGGPYHRLLLYSKNRQGYQNLLYLSSLSYTKYYRDIPALPVEEVVRHREGLIVILPMVESEVGFHLSLLDERSVLAGAEGYQRAKEALQFYRDNFEELYLEIRREKPEQRFLESDLLQLSKEVGVPIVAQTEVFYLKPTDWSYKDALTCIRDGGRLDDFHREFEIGEFYLRSPEEYQELFKDLPEGLTASDEIAEKVEFQLQLDKPAPPHFKFTREYAQREGLPYTDDKEYFEYKCWEGLEERLKSIPSELHQQYRERLQYEIEIIEQMGFPGYMLIVWDFINYAKDPSRHPEKYREKYRGKPIPVGPGRGSAAGSLVAYALKITNIDPIRWGLLFERFLNPERVTLPDIDVDFCQERREEVLEYVKNQYQSTNVGQV